MARKRVTDEEEVLNPGPNGGTVLGSEDAELDEPNEAALLDVLGTIDPNDGVTVTVYRAGANRKVAYLFQCAPQEFSLERLRDDYGGGTFRVMARKGSYLVANRMVEVETPVKRSAPTSSTTDALLAEVLNELRASRAAPVAAPVDPLAQMRQMAEVINLLQGSRPRDAGGELGGFLKGVEFVRELGVGGGDREPSTPEVIERIAEKFLPPILDLAATSAAAPKAPPNVQPYAPQGGTVVNPMALFIRGELDKMIRQAAAKGVPAENIVDKVFDKVPLGALERVAAEPDPVAYLTQFHPEVAQYKGWFQSLVNLIRDELREDEPEKEDEGGDVPEGEEPGAVQH